MRRKAFIYRGLKGWVKNGSEIRSGFLFTQTLHDFYKNEGKKAFGGGISLHRVVSIAQMGL